jgi:PadR family transcriptional regulator PadR
MKSNQNLGEFEQVVLLAILRLKDAGAYGVSIRTEISQQTKRTPTPGAIYTTLDRLENKGLLKSSVGEATPERGGRAKRYYRLTGQGLTALRRAHNDYSNLLKGIDIFGETYA